MNKHRLNDNLYTIIGVLVVIGGIAVFLFTSGIFNKNDDKLENNKPNNIEEEVTDSPANDETNTTTPTEKEPVKDENVNSDKDTTNNLTNNTTNGTTNNQNNTNSTTNNNDSYTLKPLPLKIGKTEDSGARFIEINDYKIGISSEIVEIGYTMDIKNNVLTITSKDNKYKFVMYQLTNNYKMPSESELEKFNQTEEVKKLAKQYENKEIDYAKVSKEMERLQREYLKKIGYTAKDAPDLIMTEAEFKNIRSPYMLEGKALGTGICIPARPGRQCNTLYDWGEHNTYGIPKEETKFTYGGTVKSDFTAYIETFEYYDTSVIDENEYSIYLWNS